MKILSVRPEWAWAIMFADPPKTVENRSWQTKYRGELGIHASKRPAPAARRFMASQFGIESVKNLLSARDHVINLRERF